MPFVNGHVFVVPGTLEHLKYDDVLLSTDYGGGVGRPFWPVFGWDEDTGAARQYSLPRLSPERRVAAVPPITGEEDEPRRWLVAVGATPSTPVEWLLEGVRTAFHTVASDGNTPAGGPPRRVAMPVMGVGRGGFNGRRGEVIHGLFREAQAAADQLFLDVVIVAADPSDYSALQALRAQAHARPLAPTLEKRARRVASLARAGRLALFMGAGTGMAAGLPSWSGLLKDLGQRVGIDDATGWGGLNSLDAAEILRRAAEETEAAKPVDERRPNPLGAHVSEIIRPTDRYALGHVLLAALDVDQVVTTNFDRLFERAVSAIGGEQPLVVLPDGEPVDLERWGGRRPWLLKLHGDVEAPESIVLDRRSFVRYDARRRPLGGVLQTTLLTKHLLVVGASMTDDNVIRLVHEVAELTERPGGGRTFGTVLSLGADPLRERLWRPEFEYVDLSDGSQDKKAAARNLEVFLDRVAMLAAPRSRHLLDPRYRELLGSDLERDLAERLSALGVEVAGLPASATSGWRDVVEALSRVGAPVAAATTPDRRRVPVPPTTSDEGTIWTFALTYNGYRRHGGFGPTADLANAALASWEQDRRLPDDLASARAALFFEQRRWRHFGTDPRPHDLEYLRALLGRIATLSGGYVEVKSPHR
ncbi:SIR2-like domain-containing protein [Geodermatophilus aquaeductus]|uniref:SIR2-like domain-containing protein n=1 Tax=Geodermatophilus aquaeductus TaxID=1564161 RepID=A0A521EY31_9ACTN|nr:SIR2-like domain-containing protein [Geodermatophilus aquaeductus]